MFYFGQISNKNLAWLAGEGGREVKSFYVIFPKTYSVCLKMILLFWYTSAKSFLSYSLDFLSSVRWMSDLKYAF